MNAGNTTDDSAEYQASGGVPADIPELVEGIWYQLPALTFFELDIGGLNLTIKFRQGGQEIGEVTLRNNQSVQLSNCQGELSLVVTESVGVGIPV